MILIFLTFFIFSDPSGFLISSIRVDGNEQTQEFIILREIDIKPGDRVSKDRIEYFRDRVYSTDLFTRVDYRLEPEGDGFCLIYTVHERWYWAVFPTLSFQNVNKRRPWSVSEWEDPTYGFQALHKNVLGRGMLMRISAQAGYSQSFSLGFYDPNSFLNPDYLFFTGFNYQKSSAQNKFEDLSSSGKDESLGLYVGTGYRFSPYSNLSGSLIYRMISVSKPGSDTSVVLLVNKAEGKDINAGISLNWLTDKRNSREFATEGYLFAAEGVSLSEVVTGSFYGKVRVDGRAYYPVSDWVSLAGMMSYETGLGRVLPYYDHYLTGKDEYFRGYQSVILESTSRWLFRSELRHQVIEPRVTELNWVPVRQFRDFRWGVYALLFADAGFLPEPGAIYSGLHHTNRLKSLEKYYDRVLVSGGLALNVILPYSVVFKSEVAFVPDGKSTIWFQTGRAF